MNNMLELSYEEKFRLARNSNTSQETLEVLATDENYYVRFWVAGNPNTSQETLEILATDKYLVVRYWVAQHPNATEMIRRLVLMTNEQHS